MRASDGFNHKDLNGISGWLILPTIATFLMPIVALKDYVEVAIEYSKHPVWTAPMYTLFSVITAAIAVQLGAQAYAIYCWFKRSANYPLAYIAAGLSVVLTWAMVNGVLLPAYGVSAFSDPQIVGELVRNMAFLIIWVPYMLISKRVRATFTR